MQKQWFTVECRSWRTPDSYYDFVAEILAVDKEDAKKKVIAEGYHCLSVTLKG